jgi:dolichyl-phosphate beta-glucosyltransferase
MEAEELNRPSARLLNYFAASDRFLLKEIIVVNDGSGDDTAEQLAACQGMCQPLVVLRDRQNEGKGVAVKSGVLRASGDSVLFMDADLSTPLRYADKLLDALEQGVDVVIGSRALNDSRLITMQRFHRELSGCLCNVLVQLFFLRGSWDTQCGFKLFRASEGRIFFVVGAYPALPSMWRFYAWPNDPV